MIWLNGRLRAGGTVDVADRGLLLADGLFETIAVFGGRPFRLADHLARLDRGAALLGLSFDRDRLAAGIAALAATLGGGHGALRATVTRGPGPRGLLPPDQPQPTLLVTAAPWSRQPVGAAISLATVTLRRNDRSPLAQVKSLAALEQILALGEARKAGADDALLLNTAGRVACTAMANLFVVIDGLLVTPPLADGVLPGVMRGLLDATERSLLPADLARADAVFATNSLRLVMPVGRLDGRPLAGGGQAAAALAVIRRAIQAECGCDPLA